MKIPAVGFGFGGPGKSYNTSAAIPLHGFRGDDMVTIRHASGIEPRELDWHHTTGGAAAVDGELVVSLGPGDWVAYALELTSPTPLGLVIALKGAEAMKPGRPALDVSVDDATLQAAAAGDETTVRATTNGILAAGRHIIRLTGRASETLVRSIEAIPTSAPGPRAVE